MNYPDKSLVVFFGTPSGLVFKPNKSNCINIEETLNSIQLSNTPRKLGSVIRISVDIVLVIDRFSDNECSVLKTKILADLLREIGKFHGKVVAFIPKLNSSLFKNSKHQAHFINHNIYVYPV